MNLDKKMILLMQALVNVIVILYAAKAVQKKHLKKYILTMDFRLVDYTRSRLHVAGFKVCALLDTHRYIIVVMCCYEVK